ncbi:MAG: hypothetical protein K2Q32_01990 [Alphaproteobacteria bacterium]|nr:hypothetical protein [Alphaproteobacteria bacterium]
MTLRLSLLFVLLAASAWAGETVKTPNVEKGLLELEQKGRYQMDTVGTRNHKKELEFNVIYGVTERWKTKIEAVVDEDKAGDLTYRRTRIENVLQLTKAKDGFFADTALYNDVTFSDRSDTSHDVTFGVLGRKDIGITTNTANLFVKKDWGDTAQKGTNVIYRWQTRYNVLPYFQPGFEILGDTKKRDAFRDQTLGIGPGFYGALPLDIFGGDKNQKLGYEVAYIFGTTPATPDGTIKWKLKYAVQF